MKELYLYHQNIILYGIQLGEELHQELEATIYLLAPQDHDFAFEFPVAKNYYP